MKEPLAATSDDASLPAKEIDLTQINAVLDPVEMVGSTIIGSPQ